MPKINVYLPDDLADTVRETAVPVSAICQLALAEATQRIVALRRATNADLSGLDLREGFPQFTARGLAAIGAAIAGAGGGAVSTAALLSGILTEGDNLACQILTVMEIPTGSLRAADGSGEPGPAGHYFTKNAAKVFELAANEALSFGHNYLGCEHLLLALAAEPDGAAGRALRAAGADPKALRRTTGAALAGYRHLRATTPAPMAALTQLLRQELTPLIKRIENLENR